MGCLEKLRNTQKKHVAKYLGKLHGHPKDVCDCGDFRDQHDFEQLPKPHYGSCRICRPGGASHDRNIGGCMKFRLSKAHFDEERETVRGL